MTYAAERWALSSQATNKLATAQTLTEVGLGPGIVMFFKVFRDAAMNFEVCVQAVCKCAFLSFNNRLFFQRNNHLLITET